MRSVVEGLDLHSVILMKLEHWGELGAALLEQVLRSVQLLAAMQGTLAKALVGGGGCTLSSSVLSLTQT